MTSVSQGTNAGIQHAGMQQVYIQEKRCDNREFNVHRIRIQEQSPDRSPPNPRKENSIFNYSHNILKTGLLLRDFRDSVKKKEMVEERSTFGSS